MTLGRLFHILVMFGAILICGCGSGQPTVPRLHPVSGVVTLNDEVLPDADVVFHLQGKARADKAVPVGKTDQQGQYELISGKTLGLAPGKYNVTVKGKGVPSKYTEKESTDIIIDLNAQTRIIKFHIKLKSDSTEP